MARPGYEQSSEAGRERHLDVPYSRLVDTTPTLHDPAAVTGLPVGTQVTGTVITLDATDSIAIVNHARGAVYMHYVRDATDYSTGPLAESAWRVINIGDAVYYDAEQDTLNGIKLSLSPVASDNTTANPLFGWVVMAQEEDVNDFPKGDGLTPGATFLCAVVQA